MKDYCLFNYEWLFNDHFNHLSNEAKLYYIKLNFFANNGFVPNALDLLPNKDDKTLFNELVKNEDILVLENRDEIFITCFFLHNKGISPFSWTKTPYFIYWKDKLFIKKNGIATFKKQDEKVVNVDEYGEVLR